MKNRSSLAPNRRMAFLLLGSLFFVSLMPVFAQDMAQTKLKVGMGIEVEWQGSWYPAHILEINTASDAPFYIHYDGYGSNWDEWVVLERVRSIKDDTTENDQIDEGDESDDLLSTSTPSWVDGPYVLPPATDDYRSFVITRAGKSLIYMNSSGVIFVEGKKTAQFDLNSGYLYQNGTEIGVLDTRGQIKLSGKIVGRWDRGGLGLFYGKSTEAKVSYSYGIIYINDIAWGTALNNQEGVVADDDPMVLCLLLFVPEFKP